MGRRSKPQTGTVYLIHFETRLKHARHYLGYCDDLGRRMAQHRSGNGARLMEVITWPASHGRSCGHGRATGPSTPAQAAEEHAEAALPGVPGPGRLPRPWKSVPCSRRLL